MAKKVTAILSHWNHLVEGLQESSQQVYSSVEQAIKQRNLPSTSLSRIDYREGGIFSSKREYLRVEHRENICDICAAPFGTGFFFSWWLGEAPPGGLWGLIMSIPIVGNVAGRFLKPMTYYRKDTALMVQQSVHTALMEVVDSITKAKGLRALSETERKPVLGSLLSN